MFEAHVLHLLRKYLGEYVHGLSAEALRISVWKGDVVLKDLKLKAEALNSLKLPVTVKAGFVGTITLKVPWKSLGKEPVIVRIDRVFILAHPAPDERTLKAEDREKLFEAKLHQIEEAESATLEARSKLGTPPGGNSWLGSLIATIIGNLKISITNVHVRYEDTVSNPGHPFSSGVTLAKLAAVTMDEQGNETFDTSGALDRLRKSLQLDRLAVYHDSDTLPWKMDKKWEDLSPNEWIEIFEDGINEPTPGHKVASSRAQNRQYLVSPINGVLKYHRLGKQEREDPDVPFEKASLVLSDVSLTTTEAQYHDCLKLLEVVSRYNTHVDVSHLRPMVPVKEDPHVWWRYAVQAGLQQKKMCYRFSWDRIRYLCQLRRRYIQLYACLLLQLKVDDSEIREIERDLDSKVILLWRLLAHAKVESSKSKEAAQQNSQLKRSWFSFRWRNSTEDASPETGSEGPLLMEEKLTKEEWQAINKLLSYQPDEELTSHIAKDINMIQFLVNVSIGQAAARIISINETEILCGRFEQLNVTTKFYPRSTRYDVSLRFYGLSSPEGSLAQSVSSEKKVNALAATFVDSPIGENVDWRLSATIAPCHVTVFMESYERFLEFMRRSNAVSPTVALETATALQMKIEKVTRRAQEQFQMALEEQSRFALDIDVDAPKVRVPLRTGLTSTCDGHFLLDFGHFTLRTKEGQRDEQRQSLYSRFYIEGRDIAAFFSDCGSESWNCTLVTSISSWESSGLPFLENADHIYSLIDRCGMTVMVDQIKIPHPSFPSTRISFQVPNLGIHFCPARYGRILELLNIFYGTVDNLDQAASEISQTGVAPWSPADLSTEARILVWRGIGNSVAEWQPCFLALSGFYLYVCESEISQSYQRCSSMAGRQIFEVPSASVGGSPFCVAVSVRGMNIQKALESSSNLIIEFQDEMEKASWLKGLIQATYRASAPPSVDILGESHDALSEHGEHRATNYGTADLVINGALVETKLLIYGKTGGEEREADEETLILEILAGGGKVHLVRGEGDLTVKTKLHSLKIKDELQGRLSLSPQYLACSVQKDETLVAPSSTSDMIEKELPEVLLEEDDIFTDALPDFVSISDPVYHSQSSDMPHSSDQYARAETEASTPQMKLTKGKGISGEIFYEARDSDTSDFVSVTFSTRNSWSPFYDGTDTQMSICMSKLDFFCNRPTLVALIDFGLDVSSAGSELTGNSEVNENYRPSSSDEDKVHELSESKEKTEDSGHSFIKGLLGYGKGRVVFHLNMNVGSVRVFLNKEDSSQLAMLVQESFLLDLKVHPSSLSIEGTLGNFRLCDLSLGMDHCWGWLCDIRNQGAESLIEFTFNSYSAEDEDYEGYDYSLSGRLSAVRIVFLYKFVQEVTLYFMELATPRTEEAIKLVDKVGGFEWLIQKYEMEGSSALKLDLLLDTPIIIIPRNSMSKDFMQLDLGRLQISNEIRWHGCFEKDASAVHLDVLHAEIFGINMAIGVNGLVGKPMIREGQSLHIYVRRSLRDVFRKVPTLAVEIKIGSLHGVMSDREYDVILNCFYMNISEEPKLPPSFRGGSSVPKDTIRMLVDKVNQNSQSFLSRTVTIMAVEVNNALLELYNGIDEESPLAQIALEGLWVSYRMTSLSETDLYVTIPVFSILDIRPNTRPEMRLMLGSSSDLSKQGSAGNVPSGFSKVNSIRKNLDVTPDLDAPNSTMLLLDYRFRSSSQSYVVRLQQPRVLVVLDFLLAVGEFFVPSLGAISGREETSDPKNDPITRNSNIVLSSSIYKQSDDVVYLSPGRQLIADALGVDEYTYDGCGQTIVLSEEADEKDTSSFKSQPIIVIGRGKKLRFMNLKVENGTLLRTHTYLSSESSYSVSAEDGVSLDSFSSDNDETTSPNAVHGSPNTSVSLTYSECDNQIQSVTFEAQAVSPEFTFYDSSKSSLDDSSHCEKLLRVKMNLSFMYASKENDTWIRTLIKDLTIEAGSGLVILDPVDVSGGYTSVKDKTNISLISTDICARLSLSVISLVLNLQSQATAALELGNACPLASCTNFDRLWVSPKGSGASYNITFWRPRAPSNYVILGDCVTSRPIPPSLAVLAVSNTYGRVRKPTGFNLIGSLASILELEGDGEQDDIDVGCSLWMPIPPRGYTAAGCVAHTGRQPPPNHIVYCIRSDLVTTTTYSECLFSVQSTPKFLSGFSIWRLDNVVGSFYAHPKAHAPSKEFSCDFGHALSWYSNQSDPPSQYDASDLAVNTDYGTQQGSNNSSSSSGWDILRSVSRVSSCYMSTPHFERIWWDKGSDLRRPVSIWRPIPRSGYAIIGDCITKGLEPPPLGTIFKCDNPEISAKPIQFARVAHIVGKGFDDAFFWYPIAPAGYAALGCVVSKKDEVPRLDSVCCPRLDLVNPGNILEMPISRSSSSKGSHCWSIWKVENQACTFLARSDQKRPSNRFAYTMGDSVKPKTRENVTGEMKLRCCSLSVVDSFCGTMTPLFDLTITNINLATHGRLEAMNAVLISSIAASTFNTQLEAWEPLLEPCDGIFKFETYHSNEHIQPRIVKKVRVAATSIFNINISAANLKTFAEATESWRRHAELEQKSAKPNEESGSQLSLGGDSTYSALDEDDFQTVVVENKLGCDIYLKKVEHNAETVELLQHDQYASAWIPPPRFSDRLNIVGESREGRNYVAVQISEAKGLPIADDGNGHSFFCALRLVVESQASDQQKLFPQSARTKSVKPLIVKNNDVEEGIAKWNELFIFEVPRRGLARLELEVTNLAAKAGKGEVVGAVSISTCNSATTLKKVASVRMLHALSDVKTVVSYPLRKRGQLNVDEGVNECGYLSVSTSYFERKTNANLQRQMESVSEIDRDVGFWIGFGKEGPWESFRSLLPLSVDPRSLNENLVALEVVMKNGKKHAILRGLATVVNDSDVKLDLSVCPVSLLRNCTPSTSEGEHQNAVVEEVYENQRHQAISGWGNKWPGFRGNDPERWSTRDFSYSSKDFFEPPLPSGWRWTTTWTVDISHFGDMDGWAYAPNFQSLLKWPPNSSMPSLQAVRRRRWIRTRQPFSTGSFSSMNDVVTVLSPGSSSILPWRSTARDSDLCIQIRPHVEYPEPSYTWASGYARDNDQSVFEQGSLSRQNTMQRGNASSSFAFKLNQLEKKDVLLHCDPSSGCKQSFWLSIGTDASVLHTELNAPVYDWRISINSPFKLENRLPCPAEFTVWERMKDGVSIERQHGIISSRRSVHIYSADMRRPIYLTLCVQGGWFLEKDPVLILDLSSLGHVSFFWMVHKQSKRRLRVSVERDTGGTNAAPKTIRFFVPYWISNDSSLPLSYRIVEVEPTDTAEADTPSLSKVKSTKQTLRSSASSNYRKSSIIKRNIQALEEIEDSNLGPVMLSPQDYAGRSGSSSFSARHDTSQSRRVGISVAIRQSDYYSPGVSLMELESKERIDVNAFTSNGSYYKLSALLNMTSDRTKVVHFQPQSVFINRVGQSLCIQQYDSQWEEWFHPTDPPKPFQWKYSGIELLKLRLEGYHWSTPFSIGCEGLMCIHLKSNVGSDQISMRVEVRSGTKKSRYEVLFRPSSFSSPYRIENHSMFLPIRYRQVDGSSDSWQYLPPNASSSFLWEDLGRKRLLEVLVDGTDPSKSQKYDIDEVFDHYPTHETGGSIRAVRVTVLKEQKTNVVKVSDWMPGDDPPDTMPKRDFFSVSKLTRNNSQNQLQLPPADSEFHIILEVADLGLSIIDHTPEEILYLSVQNLLLSHSSGLGSGISRFKLRMGAIQVDNQLPLTPMPVVFRPQRTGEQLEYILKFSFTTQSNGSQNICVYPYIGFHGPENCAFLINIHEPIIWRIHEMIQHVNPNRLYESQTTAVSVDPVIQIGVLNISEIRFKVSMGMSPTQRPRGVLGFWSSLMTALGNTENMPVRINQRFHENISMRQSALISNAVSNIQKDLLGQPLQLLSGVDILGNASSALGHMSKGVAALSMDKKFMQGRQRQDKVEDIGDVIREGGGALAKGLFRGVTGIWTKPLEGAKSSGVEGFVQGVGKGLIGVAAQPVSGVLDLLSKTTEGANAVRMKITAAITSEEQLLRRRLPRVISGDNLLHPYDDYRAQGQVILQLAESGAFFGQVVDLFKVRGKFALSDSYEDHFLLPKGKILVVTHRRVLLLQQPSTIMAQRKFSPARDPCSVLWDVLWDDLMTMELTHGKKDHQRGPPSRLVLYLQTRSTESREHTRIIKCIRESQQAVEIYSSIEQAMSIYGPNHSMGMQKKKATKPYTPGIEDADSEVIPKEGACVWSPQQVPASLSLGPTFGSSST